MKAEDNGSFLATVEIDEKWLSDPGRVFPVVVDPTVYAQPDVADGWYDTVNGGNPTFESVVKTGAWGVGSPAMMSVLTFDLGSIPPAAKVLDTHLNVWLNACFPGSCDPGNAGSIRLRRLTGGWSASTPWSTVSANIDATSL